MKTEYTSYLKSQIGQLKITADETAINSILFIFPDTDLQEEITNEVRKEFHAKSAME